MSIRDAMHIAWTKYRTKRIIGTLTAVVAGIMLLLLLLLSIVTTGLGNTIDSIPGLGGRYLLFDRGSFNAIFEEPDPETEQVFDFVFSEDEIREEFSKAETPITAVHRQIDLPSSFIVGDKLHIDGEPIAIDTPEAFFGGSSGFALRSNSLLEPRLAEGQDLEIGADGSLPVFINANLLAQLEGVDFDALSITERAQEFERLTSDNFGRVLEISDADETEVISIRVVGIAPNDAITEQSSTSFIALDSLTGQDRAQVNSLFSILGVEEDLEEEDFGFFPAFGFGEYGIQEGDLFDFFGADNASSAILEFDNAQDLRTVRNEFRCGGFTFDEECRELQIIGNATLEFEDIVDDIWSALRFVVGFFAVVTGVFIMIVTWKLMSESRKETGVFRAMGASKLDIAKIYLSYTALISSIGFVLALIGAVIIAALMNQRFSPELTTQLSNFTGAFGTEVSVSFLGINILHIIGIWLFALVVGFIAGIIPVWYNASSSPIKAIRSE